MKKTEADKIIDRNLLKILICPISKESLILDEKTKELISNSAKLAYPIKDGIPILLPEEARRLK